MFLFLRLIITIAGRLTSDALVFVGLPEAFLPLILPTDFPVVKGAGPIGRDGLFCSRTAPANRGLHIG